MSDANQGLIVCCARAVGVDLLNAAAGECGKLFDNGAVDKDAEPTSTHGAMLQRPAIDHNLAWLIRRCLDRGGKGNLVPSPSHVEVGHILYSERDSYQDVRTLESHPVDGVVYGLAEEVRLAGRRGAAERVAQSVRSATPEVREAHGRDGHDVGWTREHCSHV